MSLRIELLDEPLEAAAAAAIDQLLDGATSPDVLGYHARAYQAALSRVLGDRVRHLIARDAGGAIVGYLPFRERMGAAGRALCALPFFGPNGLVHAIADAPPDTTSRLVGAYREAAADALSVVLYTPFLAPAQPMAAAFAADDRIEKFTQYLDLATLQGWPPKRRADVKRAVAAGLRVRPARADDLDAIVALHRASATLAGAPVKPASYLAASLALALERPATARFTVAVRGDDPPVGCLLTVQGPVTVSYVLPAAATAERANQPIALLIDESVAQARRDGRRYWNMESSARWGDAVFKFKERWGASTASYDILIAYPSGRAAATAVAEPALKAQYPYYFVRPFQAITGTAPDGPA